MDAGHGRPTRLDVATTAALCAGILVVLTLPWLPPLSITLVALMLALVAMWCWPQRRIIAWITAFALGVSLCTAQGHRAMSERLPEALSGALVSVDLRLRDLPRIDADGARFIGRVERVLDAPGGDAGLDLARRALEGRSLAVRAYGGGHSLRPGETWRWTLRLRAFRPPAGPGQADRGRRALLDGTIAEAAVQTPVRPLRLAPPSGIDAVRDSISQRVAELIGGARGRFVAALAVGDTRGLDDSDWARLRQFGLTHLIAISGFHVGIVAGLGVLAVRVAWWIWPSLALIWRRPQAAALAATVVAVAYAGLAGFSLPTVRTVLMVAVVAAVQVLRRRTPTAQPLLLAVALIAVVDPFALLTPGFWLSCGGVAWLLWCMPGASKVFDFRNFLTAQWVATLGLMPIAAAFFLQVPMAGPLANLVAIPWISLVVVPLSLLGTLLLPFSDWAADAAWTMAAGAMEVFWRMLEAVPPPLAASHWIPTPSLFAVALAVLGIAIVLLPRGVTWRFSGLLLVLPLLAPRVLDPIGAGVEAIAFSFPRGDAVLLRSAGSSVLVDAGPARAGLVDALRALGVRRIDLRIETRASPGRVGGVLAVDDAFPPAQVWQAPSVAPFAVAGSGAMVCARGARQRFAGFEIEALHPAPGFISREPDAACVLRVRSASAELWLVSDAGRWVAHRLVDGRDKASIRTVWGAPAALAEWQAVLGAETALATRAPGPVLANAWPQAWPRVDREGALAMRFGDGTEAESAVRPLRHGVRRWWDEPLP